MHSFTLPCLAPILILATVLSTPLVRAEPAETSSLAASGGRPIEAVVPTPEAIVTRTDAPSADPFAAGAGGMAFRESATSTYRREFAPATAFTYEVRTVTAEAPAWGGDPAERELGASSQQHRLGVELRPAPLLTLRGQAWSDGDSSFTGDSRYAQGFSGAAETQLPGKARLTLAASTAQTGEEALPGLGGSQEKACEALFSQPVGPFPLNAELKARIEETQVAGEPSSRKLPSLEQALVWRPQAESTLRFGLRQQQYQAYPGVAPDLNGALFADWQQKLHPDLTWRSYAEVVDTRTTQPVAPLNVTSSGTNGSPQQSTTSPGTPLATAPSPFGDNSVTFTTGPSFQLQKDLSARIEYSNRWDQAAFSGSNRAAAEQRVSVSLQGSF